jgi:four helix bundle protein
MDTSGSSKQYDLEERTFRFAQAVRVFVKKLPITVANAEDIKQVVKSSGSIGANYIEANESLSKKDFILRIKISRKEAKETIYWLRLIDCGDNTVLASDCEGLLQEAVELKLILSSILKKSDLS